MTKNQNRLLITGVSVAVFILAGVIIWTGMRSPAININSSNKNTAMVYTFPGILPDSRIADKKAVITTSKGVIEFTLNAKTAPKTVSNFVYLVEQGFYDDLTFHRVVPGFVIQGGDPSGNGTGGPGYQFADEPVQGEYVEGAVAMANSGANTNGSQFFITLADVSKSLPKQYNLFGQVTKGMDVVKKIAIGDVMQSVKIISR